MPEELDLLQHVLTSMERQNMLWRVMLRLTIVRTGNMFRAYSQPSNPILLIG